MSTPQEYWDACLIKTWRNHGQLIDAMQMFTSMTGKKTDEIDPPLLRLPRVGVPWKLYVRAYMAAYLEKISKRLWEQPPEKDVLLLKKLQTSKYDTTTQNTDRDSEMETEIRKIKTNQKRNGMNTLSTSIRNQATDWGVTKGSARVRTKRR
jgi:hypothetical protein